MSFDRRILPRRLSVPFFKIHIKHRPYILSDNVVNDIGKAICVDVASFANATSRHFGEVFTGVVLRSTDMHPVLLEAVHEFF